MTNIFSVHRDQENFFHSNFFVFFLRPSQFQFRSNWEFFVNFAVGYFAVLFNGNGSSQADIRLKFNWDKRQYLHFIIIKSFLEGTMDELSLPTKEIQQENT